MIMPDRGAPKTDADWHRHGMRSPAEIAQMIAARLKSAVDDDEVRYEDFIDDPERTEA
ncbi:hypothetical protein [Curtobacterium sp. Leaf261]|uniref:hypothetical protein n=1 Tax=Curtobacterium sp. Leaf261 TaxID=1736311 RepID=UPI0012E15FC2|nr:hypothetical protein [Curtobacterium sp. Leaf261]